MRSTRLSIAIGCLVFSAAAMSQALWLTVVGYPGEADVDLFEVNPVAQTQGWHEPHQPRLKIRINRKQLQTEPSSIAFRSYTATVLVNCHEKNIRFILAEFYMAPFWGGTPHKAVMFPTSEIRSAQFQRFEPDPVSRLVRSVCVTPYR